MTPSIVKLGLPLLVTLAAGCTTMGTGTGSDALGADPVSFSWKSSDSVSGTMDATLSDGKTYSGQFFQITKQTTVDSVGPLWSGWQFALGRHRRLGLLGFHTLAWIHHALLGPGRGQSRCSERRSHALQNFTLYTLRQGWRGRPRPVPIAPMAIPSTRLFRKFEAAGGHGTHSVLEAVALQELT